MHVRGALRSCLGEFRGSRHDFFAAQEDPIDFVGGDQALQILTQPILSAYAQYLRRFASRCIDDFA